MLKFRVLFYILIAVLAMNTAPAQDMMADIDTPLPEAADSAIAEDEQAEYSEPYIVNCDITKGQIVMDDQGLVITTREFENSPEYGINIWFDIENQTDKKVTIISDSAYINGYEIGGWMVCDVLPKAKMGGCMTLGSSDLARYGIDTVFNILTVFQFVDPTTYEPYYVSDVIKIETTTSETDGKTINTSGSDVYADTDFKVVYQGISDSSGYNPTVHLYFENNFDKPVDVTVDEIDLNDGKYKYPVSFQCAMQPGSKTNEAITLKSDDIEKILSGELNNFAFYINVINPDTKEIYLHIGPVVLGKDHNMPATDSSQL